MQISPEIPAERKSRERLDLLSSDNVRVKRKAELIPNLSPVLCGGSDESPAPPPSPTSLSDCSDTEMGFNEPPLLCKSENKKRQILCLLAP